MAIKFPLTLHGYDYGVLVDADGEFVADFGTKAKRPATALAAEACRKLNAFDELTREVARLEKHRDALADRVVALVTREANEKGVCIE